MHYTHLAGFLAKDVETRVTGQNQKVSTLVIATKSRRNGQEETIWWRATLWGSRWDNMLPYLTKGKPLMIGGQMLKPEIYVDKSGSPQIGSIDITADYVQFAPSVRQDQPEGVRGTHARPDQSMAAAAAPYIAGKANLEEEHTGFIEEESLPF